MDFTSNFSKIGNLTIKSILGKEKLNYSQFTLVQESDPNNKLECKAIKKDEVMTASVNPIIMPPSIKITAINNVVNFF